MPDDEVIIQALALGQHDALAQAIRSRDGSTLNTKRHERFVSDSRSVRNMSLVVTRVEVVKMTNDRDVVKMMSERDVVKETSNDERKPISPSAATRIVQIGAALLLGGGFYYGFTRQQRIVVDEKLLPPHEKRAHQQVRIRSATFLERKLGLDRPRNPGSAAGRALLGGTIVAVSGFAVLISAVGAVLGVSNIEQFRLRMEQISSGVGKNMSKVMAIEQTPRPSEFASEEEEMEHLSAIFEESMKVNDVAAEAHAVELDKQAQS